MAHAMMGFCIAVCWLFAFLMLHPGRHQKGTSLASSTGLLSWIGNRLKCLPMWVYVIVLFLSIPAKEVVDIVFDASNYANSPVKANRESLIFDSITDISFWWTGMFLGTFMVAWFTKEEAVLRRAVPFVGLLGCIAFWYLYAGGIWLNQKRTFDNSGIPFNYTRLAVLSGLPDITFASQSKIQWETIESDFRQPIVTTEYTKRPPQRHYVIVGGTPEQRSKLAVSMGCEYAFKLRGSAKYRSDNESVRVRYFTATALLEYPTVLNGYDDATIECVIIDDLDVSTQRPSQLTEEKKLNYYRNAAKERKDQMVVISKKQLENLNKKKLPIQMKMNRPWADVVELTLSEFDKVAPPRSTLPNEPPLDEAKSELEARVQLFDDFGSRTGPNTKHNPDDTGISTIWVLAGSPGAKNTLVNQAWNKRKDDWITEMACLLRVKKNQLRIIELSHPEPINGDAQ